MIERVTVAVLVCVVVVVMVPIIYDTAFISAVGPRTIRSVFPVRMHSIS